MLLYSLLFLLIGICTQSFCMEDPNTPNTLIIPKVAPKIALPIAQETGNNLYSIIRSNRQSEPSVTPYDSDSSFYCDGDPIVRQRSYSALQPALVDIACEEPIEHNSQITTINRRVKRFEKADQTSEIDLENPMLRVRAMRRIKNPNKRQVIISPDKYLESPEPDDNEIAFSCIDEYITQLVKVACPSGSEEEKAELYGQAAEKIMNERHRAHNDKARAYATLSQNINEIIELVEKQNIS